MEDLEMFENGSSQIPALIATGTLPSSSSSRDPESPPIPDADSFAFAALFEQSAKIVLTALFALVLFPAMLTLSVVAILVARVLGVPLWAPASSFTHRARSRSE
jgi:hypothetical protein